MNYFNRSTSLRQQASENLQLTHLVLQEIVVQEYIEIQDKHIAMYINEHFDLL